VKGTADRLHAAVKEAGIEFVACLPDDWLVPLIERLRADPDIRYVPVARECEIVGLCAGAWLGGKRAMGLMGGSGLLVSAHEFVTLNLAYQVPFFVLAARRGTIEDPHTYQVGQGLVLDDYLDAVGADQIVMEDEGDLALLPAAYRRAMQIKRPLVCFGRRGLFLDS
jgi:sulfopyruvate decarboxylase subunit alpha